MILFIELYSIVELNDVLNSKIDKDHALRIVHPTSENPKDVQTSSLDK